MRFLDTSRIRTRFDVRVPATDGTELSVDLYLPPEPGRYPILLNRTPADNNRPGRPSISVAPSERWKVLAALGFIVAAADVRGRGDSDGQFIPFVQEGSDGAATVAWLRTLPESNGKIGLFGSGYGAFCAWAAAVADGQIDAVASISAFGAVGHGLVHSGGAVRLDWLFWMHLIGGRTVQPPDVPPWKAIYRHRPLNTLHEALGRSDIWWHEWMEHLNPDDPYWQSLNLSEQITALGIPGLHVTGWWDGQVSGTWYYYEAARRSRAPQRLIVGPWDTAAARRPAARMGGFDFGPRAILDLDEVLADFFGEHLTNRKASDSENLPPPGRSALFVTGRNEWVSEPHCRLAGQVLHTLHLSSRWGANTRRGDGTLSLHPPSVPGTDLISANPEVPVPFQPQFSSFAARANPLEFTLEQSHITERDEALVYTSGAFETVLTVWGAPTVSLTLYTEAPDADLFVLLSDSFPLNGRDLHLSHTAIRLATLEAFRAGEPFTMELKLSFLAHDFLPGHQIRLTLTPSLYPLYASNPQTGRYAVETGPNIATLEVRHGPSCHSLLTLPVTSCASNVVRSDPES